MAKSWRKSRHSPRDRRDLGELDHSFHSQASEWRPSKWNPLNLRSENVQVFQIKNGPTIYHSGDTAYFKDMETIGENYSIDVALLNIGGHFGMEPKMAAKAAQSVRAKLAIPQHFGTFPGIVQTAESFAAELKKLKIGFYEMKPGATISFRGKQLVRGN